jgi:hypothetical protein
MKRTQIIETNEHNNKKVYENFKSYAAAKRYLKSLMISYKRAGIYSKITLKKDVLTLHHGDSDNVTTLLIQELNYINSTNP